MTNKPTQVRLTDVDRANIEELQKWLSFPSASSVIRYAINRLHREMARDEARADADEARNNYNRGLGLP